MSLENKTSRTYLKKKKKKKKKKKREKENLLSTTKRLNKNKSKVSSEHKDKAEGILWSCN